MPPVPACLGCDLLRVCCCSFSAVHQQMVAALLLSCQAQSCSQQAMTSALKLFLLNEKSCLPTSLPLTSKFREQIISQPIIFSIQSSREGHGQLGLNLCSLRLVNQSILECIKNAWAECLKPVLYGAAAVHPTWLCPQQALPKL